ncbi:MAG: nucleotidyltransferase family protein [Dehalococcoidia bacterium]
MDREDVLSILHAHRVELDRQLVKRLALFGSFARDEAGPESDVDLLVEFSEPVGLFHFGGVQQYLEQILMRPVDLAPVDGIKHQLRQRILQEAIPAGQRMEALRRGHARSQHPHPSIPHRHELRSLLRR